MILEKNTAKWHNIQTQSNSPSVIFSYMNTSIHTAHTKFKKK